MLKIVSLLALGLSAVSSTVLVNFAPFDTNPNMFFNFDAKVVADIKYSTTY
jgi:hypothetical protein